MSTLAKDLIQYIHSQSSGPVAFFEMPMSGQSLPYMFSVILSGKDSKPIKAYGQAESKDEASFKTLMEALERIIIQDSSCIKFERNTGWSLVKKNVEELQKMFPTSKNWISGSSNGVAVHTDRLKATDSAINELIERHVVLKSLKQRIAPLKTDYPGCLKSGKYSLPKEIKVDFYTWRGPLGRFVVVARGSFYKRSVYGFGCSQDIETAKKKAFFEISPRLALLIKSAKEELKVMAVNKHFLFHWYEDSTWTDNFFKDQPVEVPMVDMDICEKDIWIGNFEFPKKLKSVGIHGVKVISPKMQQLFTGGWSIEKLNPAAVTELDKLPPEMHMIG